MGNLKVKKVEVKTKKKKSLKKFVLCHDLAHAG